MSGLQAIRVRTSPAVTEIVGYVWTPAEATRIRITKPEHNLYPCTKRGTLGNNETVGTARQQQR